MRLASALPLLALLPACTGDTSTRPRIVTNAKDIHVCIGPDDPMPMKVGEFQIQIYQGQLSFMDESTVTTAFTSVLDTGSAIGDSLHEPIIPVRLSLDSGDPLQLGSTTVEVFVEDRYFRRVEVNFLAEVLGRRMDDRSLAVVGLDHEFVIVNTCPPDTLGASPPQRLVEAVLGRSVPDFERYPIMTETGVPTDNTTSLIPPQVPLWDHTETFEVGALVAELDQQQLDDAFTGAEPAFPDGLSPNGLTLSAQPSVAMAPGPYLLAWQSVVEDVPLEISGRLMQYGFVADRDGDPTNDYQAQPPFDTDPLSDTDTWYLVDYDQGGWRFARTDAQPMVPELVPSAARVIVSGQIVLFVIPVSELDGAGQLLARFTTFAHEGDFGQAGGPWSADTSPPVDEPRLTIPLQTGQ